MGLERQIGFINCERVTIAFAMARSSYDETFANHGHDSFQLALS
jgi:hypothetical protein